ncbi:hypothetical protein TNCV_1604101 [Trichonephila clavipes]|nr:hypothetical protein TNCV_1604101 [Trichonephila clavipes]
MGGAKLANRVAAKNHDQKVREKLIEKWKMEQGMKGSIPIGRAKSSANMKLIKIGVDQDISWSSNREVGEIIWNILDRWAVMLIYSIKEVSGDFTDSLSNSGYFKVSSKIDISHIPMGIENLSYDYILRAFK